MATKQFSIEIEWRDVVGYEGLYKVSTEGILKALEGIKSSPQILIKMDIKE